LKVATAAPALSVPEVAVPTVVVPDLIVKTTVPSLTAAAVEVFATVAFRATAVAPYVAVAELAEVEVFARVMISVAGDPPVSCALLSLALKSVLWAKLA
jgi:hypothetical protein